MTPTGLVDVLRWYSLLDAGAGRVIGVVARLNPVVPDWAVYVGIGQGGDEAADAGEIAAWGAKLEEEVARVYAGGKEYAAWPYRR